jgi:hypothetical protein
LKKCYSKGFGFCSPSTRSFHTFRFVRAFSIPNSLMRKKDHLIPGEFVNIVTKFGDISSYEGIPAAELEICDNTFGVS